MTRSRRAPTGLTLTLTLAMGAGPTVVFLLSATGPIVIDRFGLARAEFGALTSLAFASAALASVALGHVVDNLPALHVVLCLQVGAATALLLMAISYSFHTLAVALVLSGLVQGLANPVTNRLVATHLEPGHRGVVMGIKQSGVQMSQLTAGVLGSVLAVTLGWEWAVLAAVPFAGFGAAAAITTLRGSEHPSRSLGRERSPAADRLPRQVWWLAAYVVLTGVALQAVNAYLPLFSYQAMEIPVGRAGATAAAVGATGVVARIAWGHMTERVQQIHIPMVLLAIGAVCGVASLSMAQETGHEWLVWLGSGLLGGTGVAANVVVMVAVLQIAPMHLIGRTSGVLATGLFVGFAVGPVTFGRIADANDGYHEAWTAVAVAYAAAAVVALAMGRFGPRSHPTGRGI